MNKRTLYVIIYIDIYSTYVLLQYMYSLKQLYCIQASCRSPIIYCSTFQKYEASNGKIKINISSNVNAKSLMDGVDVQRYDSFGAHVSVVSSFESRSRFDEGHHSVMSS